jgi:hypothetical protein
MKFQTLCFLKLGGLLFNIMEPGKAGFRSGPGSIALESGFRHQYPDPYQMFRTVRQFFAVSDDFTKMRLYGPQKMAMVHRSAGMAGILGFEG